MSGIFFDKISEEDLLHFLPGSHFDYKIETPKSPKVFDTGEYEFGIVKFVPVYDQANKVVDFPNIKILETLKELITIGVVRNTKNNFQVLKEFDTNKEFYIDGIDFKQVQELVELRGIYSGLSRSEKEFLLEIVPVVSNCSEKLKLKLRGYSRKFHPNALLNILSYLYVEKGDKSNLLNLLGNIASTEEYSQIRGYIPRNISFDKNSGEVKLNRRSLGVLKPNTLKYEFFAILYKNIGNYVKSEDIMDKLDSIGKITDIKDSLPPGIKKIIDSGNGIYRIK